MNYQNNKESNVKKRKSKKKRSSCNRARYVALCLLIAIAVFGTLNLLKRYREVASNKEHFSLVERKETNYELLDYSLDSNSNFVNIVAGNAIVINSDTNEMLYQKNATDKIAPASTAKMITALTVLDYYSPDDEIKVGSEIEMISEDSSRAWLMKGDRLTVKQLLIALMLPSGNDAAYTLAVNTGKKIAGDNELSKEQSIEVFMNKVNQKSKLIGAENSNFLVPDGQDADGQYTTAYDLAVIAKACLDNPYISDIVASYFSTETWLNGRDVTYQNTNELLNPDSQWYTPEVIGLKTGTSSLGGACIVSAVVINENTYIFTVMGSTENDRFQDSIDIIEAIKLQ